MKKFCLIIIVISLFVLSPKVYAAGGFNISSSKITLYQGETTTVTISSENAVGKLNIFSDNSDVASVSTGSVFIQTPDSTQSFNIVASSLGNATISVVASNQFATMDEEILTGQTKTIAVSVVAKPNNGNNNSGNNGNSNNNSNNSSNNNNNKQLSKNNNLKKITVEGYKIEKVDEKHYTLNVNNTTEEVNIIVEAEDSKAKVEGNGKHLLVVGENTFEIIIISESGDKNTISVTVNRNKAYSLDDIEEILKNDTDDIIEIDITDDESISSNVLSKIKNSGKTLVLNCSDSDRKYSLIINGSQLNDFEELNTKISFDSANKKEMLKLSNYADGVYLSFHQNGDFPDGVDLKIYVGDKFSNGDKVSLYYYDKELNKMILYRKDILVQDESVVVSLDKNYDYLFTMSEISESNSNNRILTIGIPLLAVFIIIGSIVVFKKKSLPKKKLDDMN